MRVKDVLRKTNMAALVAAVLVLAGVARPARAQDEAAPKAPPGTLKVEPDVMEKRCVKKVSPIYPQMAQYARVQGTVKLRVLISKSGTVTPLEVVFGHPLLVDSGKSTVRKWQYKPYIANGQPVAVTTDATVVFLLDAPEGAVTHPNQ